MKNRPGILAFLDQKKAYDRVDHQFMVKVLLKMGFPPCFVDTIAMVYQDAHSSVLVNGHQSPEFAINRGVRQGDPLSCLLFICVIETLAKALQKEMPGIILPDGSRATHSMFADDTKVIMNNTNELPLMLDTLQRYERASGAKLNMSKSSLLAIGSLQTPTTLSLIPWAADGEPVTYLGGLIGNA